MGDLVSTTPIKELHVDGNQLECEGFIELIKHVADQAEMEMIERTSLKEMSLDTIENVTKGIAVQPSAVSINTK